MVLTCKVVEDVPPDLCGDPPDLQVSGNPDKTVESADQSRSIAAAVVTSPVPESIFLTADAFAR